MVWATDGSYRFGDLYRYAPIKRFKPSAPIDSKFSEEDAFDAGMALTDECQTFLVGDSFAFKGIGDSQFAAEIQQSLAGPVFTVNNNAHGDVHDHPCTLLKERAKMGARGSRVLLLEMVERLIPGYFANEAFLERIPLGEGGFPAGHRRGHLGEIKRAFLADTEKRHTALLRHCHLWAPINESWHTWVFETFGQLPAETPLCSADPPMLFFRDEVDSYRARFEDQQIDGIAERLAKLANVLRQSYDTELLFVPVPNKMTVYAGLVTKDPGNQFLPRLCTALANRNVRFVNVLPKFQEQRELVYLPSDTHWNALGLRIAARETVRAWPVAGAVKH